MRYTRRILSRISTVTYFAINYKYSRIGALAWLERSCFTMGPIRPKRSDPSCTDQLLLCSHPNLTPLPFSTTKRHVSLPCRAASTTHTLRQRQRYRCTLASKTHRHQRPVGDADWSVAWPLFATALFYLSISFFFSYLYLYAFQMWAWLWCRQEW